MNVKASALYWHIKDKHELLQLMADKICEEIQWSEEDISWQEKIFNGMGNYEVNDFIHILQSSDIPWSFGDEDGHKEYLKSIDDLLIKIDKLIEQLE